MSFTACLVHAQNAPSTRAEEIEQAREAKQAQLHPDEPSKLETRLRDIKDQRWLERITAGYNGFRAKIGNMVTGGGFALGPEYLREDLIDGTMMLRASAQGTTRRYVKLEAETGFRNLLNDSLTVNFLASHRNYGGLNYYGPGPNSTVSGRSNYRLEDTSADVFGAFHPGRFVKLGASTGGLWVNVGPGTDGRLPSSEQLYSPAVAPGID
ncbi:MAG: hypothetical protein AB7O65_06295, partial [Candidatus Korobacteraceae bacterium]